MVTDIFVNLPVKDLKKTMDFWGKLGFTFNKQFTNEKAASLVLGEHIYAMLITEPFFKTFIKKEIADSSKVTETINAIGVKSKKEVDILVDKAFASGGIKYKEADDYGWMYSRSFQDPDGHVWEVLYIDQSAIKKE